MEIKIEMEKPWKTVNRKKKKKVNPPWDALPCLALSKIFINLNFEDRFGSIPFVCKTWNSVISNDPHCWSSMVPESISPDDAFIKKPDFSFQLSLPSKLFYSRDHPVGGKSDDPIICPGVSRLRTIIKKSSSPGPGGTSFSSTITSLYLDPFSFSYPNNESLDHNEILHLIAHCCPNLKHICFDGFYCASIEAVLEVFHKCKKIELIDFSDSGYADSEQVLKELGNCLPNLRGIRMAGCKKYSIHDTIATHLPRIKLLAVEYRYSDDEDFQKLTSETKCCLYELQYLSVGIYTIFDTTLLVCTHIPEFHYEEYGYYWGEWELGIRCEDCQPLRPIHFYRPILGRRRRECFECYSRSLNKANVEVEVEEAYLEYCRLNQVYYYSIPKQMKEYEYYVSISKEKKETRRNHPYVVLRTRMRKNKKEASFISKMKTRKKRDKYDYQDRQCYTFGSKMVGKEVELFLPVDVKPKLLKTQSC